MCSTHAVWWIILIAIVALLIIIAAVETAVITNAALKKLRGEDVGLVACTFVMNRNNVQLVGHGDGVCQHQALGV